MTSLPRADSAHSQLPQARFDQANGVLGTRQGDTTDATTATRMPFYLLRQAPHVLSTHHAGITVLFDLRKYYTLPNGASSRIWELLAEEVPAGVLIAALEAEYDAPRARIATDVAAVLEQLLHEGLIERVPPPGSRVIRRRWWQLWGAQQ